MADAKTFTIDGTDISIIDETARERASAALESAEYNRLSLVGKYPGQDLATVLAAEIGSGENVYDALHARVQDADFSGLRLGDYIDVPLVSASAVTTQQSVRFILAHIDPYYQCGDVAICPHRGSVRRHRVRRWRVPPVEHHEHQPGNGAGELPVPRFEPEEVGEPVR